MKLITSCLAIFVITLSFIMTGCSKKEIGVGKPAYISATSLNCRQNPSTTGAVTGNFKQSDLVSILEKGQKKETIDGKENFWYLVQKDSTKGWVFGGYLSPTLYQDKKELSGNFYKKYSNQPDNIFGDVVINLDEKKYYMISFSSKIQGEQAIAEYGNVEYLENSVILRPELIKTKPELLRSSYGYENNESPYDSYGYRKTGGPTEEKKYSKSESESAKHVYFIKKSNNKIYLTNVTSPFADVTKLSNYFEKK